MATTKRKAAAFGKAEGFNYAVQIDALERNDYFKQPFGRSLDDRRKAIAFIKDAKVSWVRCKGEPSMPAVRRWVRENKPAQFFAHWQADSANYKDDSVVIYYTEPS